MSNRMAKILPTTDPPTRNPTMHRCQAIDLGRLDYRASHQIQLEAVKARRSGAITDRLYLVEHEPVITLGRGGDTSHLNVPQDSLSDKGIDLVETDRGGDVTYHGPGQLVAYPILDLREYKQDLNWYLRSLEEVGIRFLRTYGIEGSRIEGLTGVWIGDKKVMAIGISVRKWVTCHGIALNVSCDMANFKYIIPCGIADRGVTSLQEHLHESVSLSDAKSRLMTGFAEVFEFVWLTSPGVTLNS